MHLAWCLNMVPDRRLIAKAFAVLTWLFNRHPLVRLRSVNSRWTSGYAVVAYDVSGSS